MTAETSVPQSWNPPTLEGIRASGPSFSQMEFSCGESGPRSAGTDRGAGVWGSLWNQGVRAWDFAGGPLGAQVPSLARGVPTPSLDPRRTHASRHKRPSASLGLGHMGKGCQQLASMAANPQTPPSSHHHCEDPPVLPSVKGSPFTDGRTGGRPPGDGFCPSRGWLASSQ